MGVSVKTTKPGNGKTFPKAGQMVRAHYTGKLRDGTVFGAPAACAQGFQVPSGSRGRGARSGTVGTGRTLGTTALCRMMIDDGDLAVLHLFGVHICVFDIDLPARASATMRSQ
eukprot:3298455-Pleurochrysis_carterae.AAC.6